MNNSQDIENKKKKVIVAITYILAAAAIIIFAIRHGEAKEFHGRVEMCEELGGTLMNFGCVNAEVVKNLVGCTCPQQNSPTISGISGNYSLADTNRIG